MPQFGAVHIGAIAALAGGIGAAAWTLGPTRLLELAQLPAAAPVALAPDAVAPLAAAPVSGAAAQNPAAAAPTAPPASSSPAAEGAAARVSPAPADAAPDAPAAAAAGAAFPAPSFDVVRVDLEGDAVLAGRAAPGARVDILLDETVVASTTASARGEFVAFAEIPAADRPQALHLRAQNKIGGEARSVDPVLILPGGAAKLAGEEDPAAGPATPAIPIASVADPAPALLRAGDAGIELIQAPAAPTDDVTLDAVSYDAAGEVVMAGRGDPGSFARIYADGDAMTDAPIGADGRWSARVSRLSTPGRYTLRVDELAPGGQVTSRIESPFLREDPDEAMALSEAQRIVVQPGANLWRIAQARYGAGMRYTIIYNANRARIRNPDLIFPGQLFDLPDAAEAEAVAMDAPFPAPSPAPSSAPRP